MKGKGKARRTNESTGIAPGLDDALTQARIEPVHIRSASEQEPDATGLSTDVKGMEQERYLQIGRWRGTRREQRSTLEQFGPFLYA